MVLAGLHFVLPPDFIDSMWRFYYRFVLLRLHDDFPFIAQSPREDSRSAFYSQSGLQSRDIYRNKVVFLTTNGTDIESQLRLANSRQGPWPGFNPRETFKLSRIDLSVFSLFSLPSSHIHSSQPEVDGHRVTIGNWALVSQ